MQPLVDALVLRCNFLPGLMLVNRADTPARFAKYTWLGAMDAFYRAMWSVRKMLPRLAEADLWSLHYKDKAIQKSHLFDQGAPGKKRPHKRRGTGAQGEVVQTISVIQKCQVWRDVERHGMLRPHKPDFTQLNGLSDYVQSNLSWKELRESKGLRPAGPSGSNRWLITPIFWHLPRLKASYFLG